MPSVGLKTEPKRSQKKTLPRDLLMAGPDRSTPHRRERKASEATSPCARFKVAPRKPNRKREQKKTTKHRLTRRADLQLEETQQLTEHRALSRRICKQEAPRPKTRSTGRKRIRGAAHRPRTGGQISGPEKSKTRSYTNKKEDNQSTQNAKLRFFIEIQQVISTSFDY
jgi:hypothetical protein